VNLYALKYGKLRTDLWFSDKNNVLRLKNQKFKIQVNFL
jgi:hypothetical protein